MTGEELLKQTFWAGYQDEMKKMAAGRMMPTEGPEAVGLEDPDAATKALLKALAERGGSAGIGAAGGAGLGAGLGALAGAPGTGAALGGAAGLAGGAALPELQAIAERYGPEALETIMKFFGAGEGTPASGGVNPQSLGRTVR